MSHQVLCVEPQEAEPDLASLVTGAARIVARAATAAVPELLQAADSALGSSPGAVYRLGPDDALSLMGGTDAPALRAEACACLVGWQRSGSERSVTENTAAMALVAEETVEGIWVAALDQPQGRRLWPAVSEALAPFFVLGLRHAYWKSEVEAAQIQVNRRLREVETVFEIGQAMDKVEIDRLLELITEKATAVMDAQACSLMLKLPDLDALVIAASCGLPDDVVENTRIFVGEGIAGRVAATGEPLRLNSLADDPRFKGTGVQGVPGVSSSLCMPMKDENAFVQGVLCIRRRTPAPPFSDEDERLFSVFATQASLAINNAQLYAKLNHKLQEMSTLSSLTETITSTRDLDQVLNQVADNIVDVVHFDRCRIYLRDMDTSRFAARIVRGFHWAADPLESNIQPGDGVIGQVAQRQIPILVENVQTALPALQEYGTELGMQSFYAQPIVTRGRCIGVVVVSNTDPHRPITSGSIEILSMFVHQAGVAIENAQFFAGQQRRFAELTTLYEVSKTLAATSGVQKAAQTINDLAAKITDSDAGLLLLFDAAHEALSALHWSGVPDELGKRLRAFMIPVPVPASARSLREPCLLTAWDVGALFGPEWRAVCEMFSAPHRATALVPLVVEDAAVGFLLLGKRGADYGGQELRLVAVASAQAAAVLSSASSYERRIGQRDLELSAVYELMQNVRAATTLDEALDSILDIVASLVWSDFSSLYSVDDPGTTLTQRAARGTLTPDLASRKTLPFEGDSLAARALRARTALIESGVETNPPGGHSRMAIPLAVGDELIGVLTMESRTPDLYSEESVMMLHLVASQAATIYREMNSLRALTRYTDNILRSIAAGVITVDKNGYIVTWNRRAEDIFNIPSRQVIGQHYGDFIRRLQVEAPVREETMRMVELTARTGKVFQRTQLCFHTPQGDETYLNLSVSQLRSEPGEYLGVVVVFEDVTREVQMKEEVERVSKLAETGQLAANIAHELRNPLSSIKGAAQLLRNDLPAEMQAQHGEFLDIIIEEVNGLNRMTSEFLEFSRVTPPSMQTVALNAMVARLLQFMGAYLQSKDVAVCTIWEEGLPDVFVDKSQMEQVIKNIVINAAQAMPHGGTLTVETRHQESQGIAEVTFSDTGVGIPANKLEKIWTPFFTTKTKGTGLGLAIVRKIVDTHGGRLSVRSTPGEGSTFIIQLPINPLGATVMAHARTEMTDQRSDQAERIYSPQSPDGD